MQHDEDRIRAHVPLTGGTMIFHCRIVEKIDAGGMGGLYLEEDTELGRKGALKFLPAHLCQDADCRARFKREAQAAAKLDHPNIVSVHEVSEFHGQPFFSMQHVEGQSLKDVLAGTPPPLDRIREPGIQVCDGLQAAHESGITHRDIKPSNILIDSHGRARIVDFGLASLKGTDHLTKTGSTLGTIGYMSPEQVRGEGIDQRSDIFSLGVVLYELVAGRPPAQGDTEAATSRNITDADPEPLARYKSGVNAELQRVISKTLQKDAGLVAQDLGRYDNVISPNEMCGANGSKEVLTDYDDWSNLVDVTWGLSRAALAQMPEVGCLTDGDVRTIRAMEAAAPPPCYGNNVPVYVQDCIAQSPDDADGDYVIDACAVG